MNPWAFILINGLVVVYLILRLLASPKKGRPSALNMESLSSKRTPAKRGYRFSNPFEKSLNCWFDYRGEKLDAFEVLEVPQGASIEMCFESYVELRNQGAKDAALLDAAIAALRDYFQDA
jgi:hypothetical protein